MFHKKKEPEIDPFVFAMANRLRRGEDLGTVAISIAHHAVRNHDKPLDYLIRLCEMAKIEPDKKIIKEVLAKVEDVDKGLLTTTIKGL